MSGSPTAATGAPERHPAAKPFRVCWWGQFGLVDTATGADRLPRGRRARAMLALAAARPGVPILRSDLAAMFWGDRGEDQARASVRQSLAELRELASGDEPALAIDQTSVTLLPGHVSTRADQIAELIAAPIERWQTLLDRGDSALGGLDGISPAFDDWLRSERAQAAEALIDAVLAAARTSVDAGNAVGAQRLINRVQAIDPIDERVARAGFEADGAVPDAAGLERRMRGLESRLKEELGVTPSPATVKAYNAALIQSRSEGESAPPGDVARRAGPSRLSRSYRIAAAILVAFLLAVVAMLLFRNADHGPTGTQAIAVVPFGSTSDQKELGDGLAEEMVSRLSRNPRIAPLGRNSARMMGDEPASAIALGRELRVAYLLTGSVADRQGQLSISARLIRTRDGQPMWNSDYSGSTAELIPLIDRMATDVSRRLGAGALPQPTSQPPRNGVDQLYFRARSLLRGVEPQNVSTAVELLRQAARLDPDYAPVWSLLGMAVRIEHLQHLSPDGDPNSILIPQAYARRGLELAPNSALANLAMADTLAEDPRSLPYALRAAELDPKNAEIWDELAEKYDKAGDFARYYDAIARAMRIDPLGLFGALNAAGFNWDLGDRRKALQMLGPLYRHGRPRDQVRHMIRADLAFRSGDFSRAMEEYTAAARSAEEGSRVWANGGRGSVYYAIGMFDESRRLIPFKSLESDFHLFTGALPSQADVEISRKHPLYGWNMSERNYFLLRGLIRQRRFADVAALYDRRFKSPEEFSRTPRGHIAFLRDSVPVILALREVGRRREADRIVAIAREELVKRHRAGVVPSWYDFSSAQHYAVAGNDSAALAALERAVRKGWINRTDLAMRDIGDEPAFRSLAGTGRFQAIRNRLESLYARERREIEAMAAAS